MDICFKVITNINGLGLSQENKYTEAVVKIGKLSHDIYIKRFVVDVKLPSTDPYLVACSEEC